MTYEELIMGVKEWADERGIDKKENAKSQFLKLVEEVGELANAIGCDDYDKTVDSVGDIQVVLIILCEQLNLDYKYALRTSVNAPLSVESYEDMINFSIDKSEFFYRPDTLIELGKLSNEINKKSDSYYSLAMTHIGNLQRILISVSFDLDIKFKNALESAYGVIANRTGKLIDGTFVKDEDLND